MKQISKNRYSLQNDKLEFTSDSMIFGISRNIIRISNYFMSKQHLFARFLYILKQKCIVADNFERLIHYISSLGVYKLFMFQFTIKYETRKNNFQEIFKKDNFDGLIKAFVSPDFDFNQIHDLSPPILFWTRHNIHKPTLIELAASCGSIACFRFLHINNAKIDRIIDMCFKIGIIHLTIAGGNVEIIQILEQARINPDESCIEFAILSHRVEIFDWLVEHFPEFDFSSYCFESEFIHGINRIEAFEAQEKLCEEIISYLVRLLIPYAQVHDIRTLIMMCELGNTDIVKLLLTIPSINVNKYDAS